MRAFQIKRGDLVSWVGAGGKTTAMFRLADELASQGWNVITTTTTMIWQEQREEPLILESDPGRLLQNVPAALGKYHRLTIAAGLDQAQGKLIGLQPDLVESLIGLPEVDAVLVEADGARGRSLKAPAEHEPVIPARTSLLVPTAGVDALGQPLDKRVVHRPEIAARLAETEVGHPITPEVMSKLLLHSSGGLKHAPHGARIAPLLNKVTDGYVEPGRDVARALLRCPRIERVVLAAVAEEEPVKEVWGRVAAVVLSAGGSRRFGSPKQLLPWKGQTLLEHVVDTVLDSSIDEVIVVLGHQSEQMRSVLGDRQLKVVVNEDWAEGQSGSVRAGLEALPANFQACLFVLADQPNLSAQIVDELLARYRRTLAPIVAPAQRGQRGNPVLFDRALFGELLQLRGDRGGRSVVERHQAEAELVEVQDQDPFLDIDRVSDYEAIE